MRRLTRIQVNSNTRLMHAVLPRVVLALEESDDDDDDDDNNNNDDALEN